MQAMPGKQRGIIGIIVAIALALAVVAGGLLFGNAVLDSMDCRHTCQTNYNQLSDSCNGLFQTNIGLSDDREDIADIIQEWHRERESCLRESMIEYQSCMNSCRVF